LPCQEVLPVYIDQEALVISRVANPKRQQEVAFFLCDNPHLAGKPCDIAKSIGCTTVEAKLALSRLRRRLGGHIDAAQLCPQCLTYDRHLGICHRCGLEYPSVDANMQYYESELGPVDNHEILSSINQGYYDAPPIKLSSDTIKFLRGRHNPDQRLISYCLSRMANLLKHYSGIDPLASNQAALCTKRIAREFLESNGKANSKRIERADKLAIIVKVLLTCLDCLPQYSNMWKDAINRLLTFPEVVLYGE
jgi:hypothetical protein